MATPVFVAVIRRLRQAIQPDRRQVLAAARFDCSQNLLWNTDIGNDNLAAKGSAGIKHVGGLLAEESDGQFRWGGHAQNSAAIARYTRRKINRDDPRAMLNTMLERLRVDAFDRARQASAEQRIDH